jgi:hypothetical protein
MFFSLNRAMSTNVSAPPMTASRHNSSKAYIRQTRAGLSRRRYQALNPRHTKDYAKRKNAR